MRVLKIKRNSKISGKFRIATYEKDTFNTDNPVLLNVTEWNHNVVSTADDNGLNLFLKHLYGDITYPLEITHARFGTTDVTPVATDTDIDTPLAYDIEIALREFVDTKTLRYVFFAPDVFIPDDTYYTFATYCDTQVFSMALIRDTNTVDFVKAGAVDTTIEYIYSIDNA